MRVGTGVAGFDRLIEGGLPAGQLYVVSGPPGAGKTTFTGQFIAEGVRNGEECLYLTMHETRADLLSSLGSFEFGFEQLASREEFQFINITTEKGKRMLRQLSGSGGRSNAGQLTQKIAAYADAQNVDRLVVDSTMMLKLLFEDGDSETARFVSTLREADATTLLVSEMTDPTSYADEHYLAHGVIFFHNFLDDDGMTRGVQVVKMRGTNIDCDIRAIQFTDRGLVVAPGEKVRG